MKPALALVALLVLTGCSSAEPQAAPTATHTETTEATATSSTTEPDSTKVTVDGVPLDRDNWSDRFVLENKQWLRYVVSIKADDDASEYVVSSTLERPRQSSKAMEMCEDFKAMVEGEGHDEPRIEIYGDGGVLLTRVGYSTTRDGCLRL